MRFSHWHCFSLLFLLCLFPALTHAGSSVPPTCDADYYDVLRAKTYFQGKKEYEAAQRIILKQDSVLEYSCFHLDVEFTGRYGATFSENGLKPDIDPPEFNGGINIYGGSLDNALAQVVTTALVGFLGSFDHVYGGGTFNIAPPSGGACNPMNIVWYVAKCENFDKDWWIKNSQLASVDIRTLPEPCQEGFDSGRAERIATALAAAYPPPATPPQSGGVEKITHFNEHWQRPCGNAIPTGVKVEIGGSTKDDAVCARPGCRYNGSSCS